MSRSWLVPSASEARFVSILLLISAFGMQVFAIAYGSRNDFGGFYVAGKILNERSSAELYDLALQSRLYRETIPDADQSKTLTFAHPPFVAALFRPLALLPYRAAYGIWLVISGALYVCGLLILSGQTTQDDGLSYPDRRTAFLVALSFPAFLFEAWGGGQLSTLGFLALAAAVRFELAGSGFLAGLALGVLFYKPTLLVLLLPLALLGRRWRLLGGTLVSGGALVLLSVAGAGRDAVLGYPRLVETYSRLLAENPWFFQRYKYVDLSTFIGLLPGGESMAGRAVFALAAAALAVWAARAWFRYPSLDACGRAACWAATIPLLLVVNAYSPIYDVTLVVVSAFLLYAKPAPGFEKLVLALYVASVGSQPLARVTHVQVVTMVLVVWSLWTFRIASRPDPA